MDRLRGGGPRAAATVSVCSSSDKTVDQRSRPLPPSLTSLNSERNTGSGSISDTTAGSVADWELFFPKAIEIPSARALFCYRFSRLLRLFHIFCSFESPEGEGGHCGSENLIFATNFKVPIPSMFSISISSLRTIV